MKREINEILFFPVIASKETGQFQNLEYLQSILTNYENYHTFFQMDGMPDVHDYPEWLAAMMEYINSLAPWFLAVTVDQKLIGVLWADNWETIGNQFHSVEISGFTFPGVNPKFTTQSIRKLCKHLFNTTSIHVIRSVCAKDNKAALWALRRAGFEQGGSLKAWRIQAGREITGIINSITRTEFNP